MSERVSGEEMLQLKAYLAEYSRLGDEINTRLEKEGTIIQVFLGFIVGIFCLIHVLGYPK